MPREYPSDYLLKVNTYSGTDDALHVHYRFIGPYYVFANIMLLHRKYNLKYLLKIPDR